MRRITLPPRLTAPGRRLASASRAASARIRPVLSRPAAVLSRLAGPPRRFFGRTPHRLRLGAAVFLVAFAGVLLGVQLGGHTTSDVGPFSVDFSVEPSLTGDSQLQIPPLGSITVDSHDGPAELTGRIKLLDEQRTRELINDPQQIDAASDEAATDIGSAVRALAINTLLAAFTGSLLLGLVVFRNVRRAAASAGVALAIVAATIGTAAATFTPESIREPHYQGLLANVPAVIGDANNIYDRYGEYRGELIRIVTNMSRVYTNISTLPVYQPDPNTIRALHISDLHLNPTSWEVIRAIADQFQVNVIVDTGDLTDWGSKLENTYAQNIGKLGVPYVFIRGNHDTPETAAAVAKQPNAIVLDNSVRTVAGLTFAGIGDPRYTPDKSSGDLDPHEERVLEAGKLLAETVAKYNEDHATPTATPAPTPPSNGQAKPDGKGGAADDGRVDVMLIHDPNGAEEMADSVPLVLSGHTHQRKVSKVDKDTTLMVPGSTGARGLRGIGEKNPTSLRMNLLYFTPGGQLQAYDEITVSGAGQSKVELERKILTPP
jgi:predicted MPP superfamily phosphohydrolase